MYALFLLRMFTTFAFIPGVDSMHIDLHEAVATVGFHNINLRIFNLRVSNPNNLIVDVFFDTMSDFKVPGSRPKTTR